MHRRNIVTDAMSAGEEMTYPGSKTKIVDSLPVYRCSCGYMLWAVTRDKPVRCRKCGKKMEVCDDKS